MATYNGEYMTPLETEVERHTAFVAGGIAPGRSKLDERAGETVIRMRAGGNTVVYVALDVGNSVKVSVYPPGATKATALLMTQANEKLAVDRTAGNDNWEDLTVALPAGQPKGIYILGLYNFTATYGAGRAVDFKDIEVI